MNVRADRLLPGREAAWALVCEYTPSESLRRHMLAVEAAMRHYALRLGEDEERWGLIGLLHDFDYERFPDTHPHAGEPILAERGWPEDVRRTILSHAASSVPRDTLVAKALHACDEITGLIIATALVRPDRDLASVKASSVRKKWRNRAFAAGVDREEVEAAAVEFGVPLEDHIETVLEAMKARAEALGLAGADGDGGGDRDDGDGDDGDRDDGGGGGDVGGGRDDSGGGDRDDIGDRNGGGP